MLPMLPASTGTERKGGARAAGGYRPDENKAVLATSSSTCALGDCDAVQQLYFRCTSIPDTESNFCRQVVNNYMSCLASDK